MAIDLRATQARLKATGRTIAGWARSRGFDAATMPSRFQGRTRFTQEELNALEQDGLLVTFEEKKKAA